MVKNDSALNVESFTGHTGCVILAPHLVKLTKKELGLPSYKEATALQRNQGMCYKNTKELYNDGNAFKAVIRTRKGQVITLLADNYFGYCKKEVKSQISFSANLMGMAEEEHAGGALVFPSYSLGESFIPDSSTQLISSNFANVKKILGNKAEFKKQGYAIDNQYPHIVYVSEKSTFSLDTRLIQWKSGGKAHSIPLKPKYVYVLPSGYKVHMEKHPGASSWRLIGTVAEGTLCHKPCTVSGGGKSEISKSVYDSMIYKNFYIQDFKKSLSHAKAVIGKNYSTRFRDSSAKDNRPLLDSSRSLGSVIQLLSTSTQYTASYNKWVEQIPNDVRNLVLAIKRLYRPIKGESWEMLFNVDIINGLQGHELNYRKRKVVSSYLKVGRDESKSWRLFRLRIDFIPSQKLQIEDDITASVTLPTKSLKNLNTNYIQNSSVKFVENCEYRLFQRPDDAVVRGYDKQAEWDLSQDNTFISNFEPLNNKQAQDLLNDPIEFNKYTKPMKKLIQRAAKMKEDQFFVASSEGRLINGIPSPNVRYLQNRLDMIRPDEKYLSTVGIRLHRKVFKSQPVFNPVNAILIGRRNNPIDRVKKIRPLAVYSPLHYQELPELFMDYISSLTGKSPSTTGAGSEGALTKGPFNSLNSIIDLNNALLSYILTDSEVFSTPAGYIGHKYKVDHDISLLMPEVWSRLKFNERSVNYLLKNEFLEKVEDFNYKGKNIQASRLGYRVTQKFCSTFLARIFSSPHHVFPEDMLQPEKQDTQAFVEGVLNITENQTEIAKNLIKDKSVVEAIPPLKALVYIMAQGSYEGMDINSKSFRELFVKKKCIKVRMVSKSFVTKTNTNGNLLSTIN